MSRTAFPRLVYSTSGQVANICTSVPFPRRGKYPQVINVTGTRLEASTPETMWPTIDGHSYRVCDISTGNSLYIGIYRKAIVTSSQKPRGLSGQDCRISHSVRMWEARNMCQIFTRNPVWRILDILTAVTMNIVFCNVTPCGLVASCQRFNTPINSIFRIGSWYGGTQL